MAVSDFHLLRGTFFFVIKKVNFYLTLPSKNGINLSVSILFRLPYSDLYSVDLAEARHCGGDATDTWQRAIAVQVATDFDAILTTAVPRATDDCCAVN